MNYRLNISGFLTIFTMESIAKRRWIIPFTIILLYVISYSIMFPAVFLSAYNISALLLEFSIPAIMVIGMTILLISGEIDLSVGYNVMFSNVLAAGLVVMGIPVPVAILLTLITATVAGTIIGFLVAKVGVNSFIATLGLGLFFYGLTQYLFTALYSVSFDNIDIRHLPDAFTVIGKGSFLGLQFPVYYSVVLLVIFSFLMSKSSFFKKYYYVGMNAEAAVLSGINVKALKVLAFGLSALLSSLAGVLLCARMGAAASSYGMGWELKIITACVLGGVSLKGGEGSMGSAVLGMLFATCLSNGLRIVYAPTIYYKIIEGSVLLAAVILDAQISRWKNIR